MPKGSRKAIEGATSKENNKKQATSKNTTETSPQLKTVKNI